MKGVVSKGDLSPEREEVVKAEIDGLEVEERAVFDSLVATYNFGANSPDLESITHRSTGV